MKIEKITTFCFSPTGTSRKNMNAFLSGLAKIDSVHHDFTFHVPGGMTRILGRDTLAVFSVPVYGGKVAPTALQRMEGVKGDRTPAILMVTYGNRDFEKALIQLETFVRKRGFIPIAAAALVGEHSYSTAAHPIAVGRPDADDLASVKNFGLKVWCEKLSDIPRMEPDAPVHQWEIHTKQMPKLKTPWRNMLRFVWFVFGYRRRQKKHPVKVYPSVSPELCSHCGTCVDLCPTQAIRFGKEEKVDPARCIRCCACVKGCPSGVRTFDSPFAEPLSSNFQMRREPLYIL